MLALPRQPIATVDLYPTFLDLAGIEPDPKQHLDGVSIAPLLRGDAEQLQSRAHYWYYPLPEKHFLGGRSSDVVRKGGYKLIEFFDDQTVELYDVVNDVGEENDLWSTMPEKVAELQRNLAAWRAEVGVEDGTSDPPALPALPKSPSATLLSKKKTRNDSSASSIAGASDET